MVAPLRLVLFFGGWSPSSGMTVMVEEDDELDEVVVELEVALVTVDVEEERVDDEVVLVTVRNVASSSAWSNGWGSPNHRHLGKRAYTSGRPLRCEAALVEAAHLQCEW